MQSVLSIHNIMTLEIKNRREFGKFTDTWELNNTLLNNQCVKDKQNRFNIHI